MNDAAMSVPACSAWRKSPRPYEGAMVLWLPTLVDDATGTTLCRMAEEETLGAAVQVLRAGMERYGVPQALDAN